MSISVINPDYPYVAQAEEELEHVQELGDQLHSLVVETAGRVAADDGASLNLLRALNDLTTAERKLWRAAHALIDERAAELAFAAQIGASA